jgi:hypothetical protein
MLESANTSATVPANKIGEADAATLCRRCIRSRMWRRKFRDLKRTNAVIQTSCNQYNRMPWSGAVGKALDLLQQLVAVLAEFANLLGQGVALLQLCLP